MIYSTKVKYQEEKFEEVYKDLLPMFARHHEESIGNEHDIFSLDIDQLKLLDKHGYLASVSARYNEDIIGYICIVMAKHPLYKGNKYGTSLALYIDPRYRKDPAVATGLIKYAETLMRHYEVQWLNIGYNPRKDISKFLSGSGYRHLNTTYTKLL